MTTTPNPQTIIRRLKKEVHLLHRKEKEAIHQLKNVFSELKDLSKAYEKQAVAKLKKAKTKLSTGQAGRFIKAIGEVEKRLLKKMGSKHQTLSGIVSNVEKHLAGKSTKVSSSNRKK